VIGSSIALIWIGQTWSSVGYGVFLFLFSLGVLRLAAKADPCMRQVYMRSRHYKRTYLARMHTCPVAVALGKALNQPWKVSVLPRKT